VDPRDEPWPREPNAAIGKGEMMSSPSDAEVIGRSSRREASSSRSSARASPSCRGWARGSTGSSTRHAGDRRDGVAAHLVAYGERRHRVGSVRGDQV